MKQGFVFFLIAFVFSGLNGSGQIDTITKQQCLGTTGNDIPYGIEKIGNKYFYLIRVGIEDTALTNYHGMADSWIVCADSSGHIIWEKCYGGSEGDGPEKIIKIDNHTMYIFSFSTSVDGDVLNGREGNFWIIKMNTSGDIIWEKSFGNRSCSTRDAILTPDGGLLMMGRIMHAGGDVSVYYGRNDIWLCKIDSLGNIQWEKTYGNQGQDNAIKLILTSDSTYMFIGGHYESGGMIQCEDMGSDGADVWIVELDMNGEMIREYCYGGSHNDLGEAIIETENGYFFVGSTNSDDGDVTGLHGLPGNYSDIWACRITRKGQIIWQRCLGGSSSEYGVYTTQTQDSGFIVMGNTTSHNGDVSGNHSVQGRMDIWVVKLSKDGQLEWEHCFGGYGYDRFYGIHTVLKKSDYNYVLAAQSYSASFDVTCDLYGIQDSDAWIIEIKDCLFHAPHIPEMPSGPDSLCHTTDSTSTYSTGPAANAWGYEWDIAPDEAGTVTEDSLFAYVNWNRQYEGEVKISVRSFNDCGESGWSQVKTSWVYNCVGLEELFAGNLKLLVYPNPAKEKVIFEIAHKDTGVTTTKNFKLIVRDIYGKIVHSTNLQHRYTWDTRSVKAGMYFYTLISNGFSKSGKLVVN